MRLFADIRVKQLLAIGALAPLLAIPHLTACSDSASNGSVGQESSANSGGQCASSGWCFFDSSDLSQRIAVAEFDVGGAVYQAAARVFIEPADWSWDVVISDSSGAFVLGVRSGVADGQDWLAYERGGAASAGTGCPAWGPDICYDGDDLWLNASVSDFQDVTQRWLSANNVSAALGMNVLPQVLSQAVLILNTHTGSIPLSSAGALQLTRIPPRPVVPPVVPRPVPVPRPIPIARPTVPGPGGRPIPVARPVTPPLARPLTPPPAARPPQPAPGAPPANPNFLQRNGWQLVNVGVAGYFIYMYHNPPAPPAPPGAGQGDAGTATVPVDANGLPVSGGFWLVTPEGVNIQVPPGYRLVITPPTPPGTTNSYHVAPVAPTPPPTPPPTRP